ncbi:hypothetical protein [Cohnella sp. AR92]|uniref:hypothetical protein n=1 Tax=Cohnella sp. AR92 TaxID=648716 RepID=UPI000F8E9D4E|nr:hypothetical protein [Cohnella sp. AR92]RUS41956.1 hypothetical protein ELR57_27600 [Cohnella sp. AR92]
MRKITRLLCISALIMVSGCSIDNNYISFDPSKIKVGDRVAGLILKSIDFDKETKTVNAYFEGEIEITGYYYSGRGVIFNTSEETQLPKSIYDGIHNNSFLLKHSPFFGDGDGMATIVINNYEIHTGETDLMNQAVFIRKVE